MSEPSRKPTPKIAAATATGAAVVLVVWVAGLFGLEVPDYVATAVGVLLTAGAGYFKSDGRHASD
jgi:hypothetical protein